jgi:hypothetical protein
MSRRALTSWLHHGDLSVRRDAREHMQHCNEHSHRQRHGNDERYRQHEDFGNHNARQPLATQVRQLLRYPTQQHQRREHRKYDAERREVSA